MKITKTIATTACAAVVGLSGFSAAAGDMVLRASHQWPTTPPPMPKCWPSR
jgi:hypothetical protein